PVLVDQSADLADAVAKVVAGKSFDYGTVCSSEQAIVAERALRDRILVELKKHRAFLCDDRQKQALARILLLPPNWTVNPNCVGQSPRKIAQMAGFDVPEDTSVLAVEVEGVGKEHPLSAEKLSPVLSLFFVSDFGAALDTCESILRFGGLGHTCVIHARDDRRVREYALRMPAMRVLCNTPAPHGSTGITTNVFPAMTLGCGAVAGNITGDNIGPRHLMNIKRLAYETRRAEDAFEMPAVPARARAAAAVSSPAAPVTVSRGTIAAAVERYLANRGVAVAPASPAAASGGAAGLVDRFLSTKKPREAVPPPPASCCAVPEPESRPEPAAGPPHSPELAIADFVCENDVRAAMQRAARIYIGPKTIVTPAARDLAAQHDILVVAKR
ncbi:MAG: hypothetical protein HYZ57_21530, partial [Acidobacteria bacterium]|nr:hypothetical protein [Acidobacteriota bacterium]